MYTFCQIISYPLKNDYNYPPPVRYLITCLLQKPFIFHRSRAVVLRRRNGQTRPQLYVTAARLGRGVFSVESRIERKIACKTHCWVNFRYLQPCQCGMRWTRAERLQVSSVGASRVTRLCFFGGISHVYIWLLVSCKRSSLFLLQVRDLSVSACVRPRVNTVFPALMRETSFVLVDIWQLSCSSACTFLIVWTIEAVV